MTILTAMHRMGWRLAAFALLAIALRAVVPTGFMVAHADGAAGRYLTIELCQGHAGPQQVVDLDTGEVLNADDLPKGEGEPGDPAPCVFGGAVALEAPSLTAAPVALLRTRNAPAPSIAHMRPGRGIAAPPPPATGPPILI